MTKPAKGAACMTAVLFFGLLALPGVFAATFGHSKGKHFGPKVLAPSSDEGLDVSAGGTADPLKAAEDEVDIVVSARSFHQRSVPSALIEVGDITAKSNKSVVTSADLVGGGTEEGSVDSSDEENAPEWALPETVGAVPGISGIDEVAKKTKFLIRKSLVACIAPETEPNMTNNVAAQPWWKDLKESLEEAKVKDGIFPSSQWLPLEIARSVIQNGEGLFPFHRAIVMVPTQSFEVELEDGEFYPKSACFTHNYTQKGDPHGCGLFNKSFTLLKELRSCIVPKLKESNIWQAFSYVAGAKVMERRQAPPGRPNSFKPVPNMDPPKFWVNLVTSVQGGTEVPDTWDWNQTLEENGVKSADFIRMVKNMTDAENNVVTTKVLTQLVTNLNTNEAWLDVNARADEMTKHVGFLDWSGKADWGNLVEEVEKAIQTTATGSVLEPSIVSNLRTDCFKIDPTAQGGARQGEAKTLQRAASCQASMWDSSEVVAPNFDWMFDASKRYDSTTTDKLDSKVTFEKTPPVCGRLAVALMQRPSFMPPREYDMKRCLAGHMSWKECLDLPSYNCICAEKCWVAALEQVCNLNGACCADKDKMQKYDSLTEELKERGNAVADAVAAKASKMFTRFGSAASKMITGGASEAASQMITAGASEGALVKHSANKTAGLVEKGTQSIN